MLKCVAISDTHNQHSKIVIPECDVLLHAGDFSGRGQIWETKAFLEWFSIQPSKYKIFIDGNHDGLSELNPTLFNEILNEYPGVTYLRNEGCEVEGIKIWGRPTTPTFGEWWHMADPESAKMRSTLEVIPSNIDILLTHGPAKGILDLTERGERVGCEDLLDELVRIKPRYLVCGHIHHSAGIQLAGETTHINAAVLNDSYQRQFEPIEFNFS